MQYSIRLGPELLAGVRVGDSDELERRVDVSVTQNVVGQCDE
jgi:hypothetical protein